MKLAIKLISQCRTHYGGGRLPLIACCCPAEKTILHVPLRSWSEEHLARLALASGGLSPRPVVRVLSRTSPVIPPVIICSNGAFVTLMVHSLSVYYGCCRSLHHIMGGPAPVPGPTLRAGGGRPFFQFATLPADILRRFRRGRLYLSTARRAGLCLTVRPRRNWRGTRRVRRKVGKMEIRKRRYRNLETWKVLKQSVLWGGGTDFIFKFILNLTNRR